MTDLRYFLDTVPIKINRRMVVSGITICKFPYKTERALRAYAEHDALHYLFQLDFSEKSEQYISYLEKTFNCGWLPYGEKYNKNTPRKYDCGSITLEMIDEISQIIYEIYDDYEDT
jgi:hypothetical protein